MAPAVAHGYNSGLTVTFLEEAVVVFLTQYATIVLQGHIQAYRLES